MKAEKCAATFDSRQIDCDVAEGSEGRSSNENHAAAHLNDE